MSGIKVVFPVDQLSQAVDACAKRLYLEQRNVLDLVGVQLLQFAQLDYVTKARGGTGTDGISWAPIQAGTLLARMRRGGNLGKIKTKKDVNLTTSRRAAGLTQFMKIKERGREEYKEQRAANLAAYKDLERAGVIKVLSGGSGDAKFKSGAVIGIRKDRKTGSTREALRRPVSGGYEIGVNTGLQRNSASPGYVGRDGKGGNIKSFDPNGMGITVGFGRSYSEHFDRTRKLFPDVLPAKWIEGMEEHASEAGGKIIEDALREHGLS